MFRLTLLSGLCAAALMLPGMAVAGSHNVSSLKELISAASESGNTITMEPGTYSVRDYLTPELLSEVGKDIDRSKGGRPPLPVLTLSGSDNTFNLDGVVLEVDTRIYDDLPRFGYHRLLFLSGHRNKINGLTMRYIGPNQGTNGNALTVWGDGNTLAGVTVFVHGSSPYGYGDLLGKGKPGLAPLEKQSGIMVGGDDTTLRRCKVISRAFGHCFYIQGGRNTLIENCYAEGVTRSTNDMLRERGGMAEEFGYRSVYENRDGRFAITPGYRKSLTEDGFRTYGSGGPRKQATGKTTLINCTAINTRAGFEIVGPTPGSHPAPKGEFPGQDKDGPASANASLPDDQKTTLIGCTALGTERAYLLIGGNIITRRCRGDIVHGPLLYLWRGQDADVELEVVGEGSDYTVHALATISGAGHRVVLTRWEAEGALPKLPIMLGYGMPAHAEMSTPILEEEARQITLDNQTGCPVVTGSKVVESHVVPSSP